MHSRAVRPFHSLTLLFFLLSLFLGLRQLCFQTFVALFQRTHFVGQTHTLGLQVLHHLLHSELLLLGQVGTQLQFLHSIHHTFHVGPGRSGIFFGFFRILKIFRPTHDRLDQAFQHSLRVVVQLEDLRNKDIFVFTHDGHSHHQLQQVQHFFRIVGFRDGVDINRAGVDSLVQHSSEVVIQHTQQLSEIASRQGPVACGLLVKRIFLEVVRAHFA
mmetsp:Transcript_42179/g.73347  ORF Transcript_42179/g.73347 Transcript_42179/m.73347 type:complete len:215 (-) Transcript_42179:207-851(-)